MIYYRIIKCVDIDMEDEVKASGIGVRELARKVGVSPSFISKLLRGKRSTTEPIYQKIKEAVTK